MQKKRRKSLDVLTEERKRETAEKFVAYFNSKN